MFLKVLVLITFLLTMARCSMQYKTMLLEDSHLCSLVKKRKLKLGTGDKSALIVGQNNLNIHSVPWNVDSYCKFEVQSGYNNGGIAAVIQKLNFRRNESTGECLDYLRFRTKEGERSRKYCGEIDINEDIDFYTSDNLNLESPYSFVDSLGEMDVEVFVSKQALSTGGHMELVVAFTSFIKCSKTGHVDTYSFRDNTFQCKEDRQVCIYVGLQNDGIVNCPFPHCVDEVGCDNDYFDDGYDEFPHMHKHPVQKLSIGNKVLIGSLSTLFLIFALFVLCMWAFKHHKLFCWAPKYTRPSTPDRNATDTTRQVPLSSVEINDTDQTSHNPDQTQPTAPPPESNDAKDLPPSYDSLFPNNK